MRKTRTGAKYFIPFYLFSIFQFFCLYLLSLICSLYMTPFLASFIVSKQMFFSALLKYVCVCSVVSDAFVILWTVAHQAPLSMTFSRQDYWSGLPFPPPGDLPDSRIEPVSPALAGGFFTTEPPGKLSRYIVHYIKTRDYIIV